MLFKGLIINEDVENPKERTAIVEALKWLYAKIENKYSRLNATQAVEFNIGIKLEDTPYYLVIYNNPGKLNNPYLFVKAVGNEPVHSRINLSDFECLTKYDRLQRFSKSIANSFMRLPKFMFLGELDIGRARELANIVDEYKLQQRIQHVEGAQDNKICVPTIGL